MTIGLTDRACAAAAPQDREYLLGDGAGLSLRVRPDGHRDWLWRYVDEAGTRRKLSLGSYPAVSLAQARRAADEKRQLRAAGRDPRVERIRHRQAARKRALDTFEKVGRAWHAHATAVHEWSASYSCKILRQLEIHAFPALGGKPIGLLTPPEVYAALNRVAAAGTRETAVRLRESVARIYRHAVSQQVLEPGENFMAPGVADFKLPAPRVRHHAAVLDTERLGQLLRDLRGYSGHPTTRALLMITPLLFQRPGQTRRMAWEQLDLEAGIWTCPPALMKMREMARQDALPHIVPLPRQAVEILRGLAPLTGPTGAVFASVSRRRSRNGYSRFISENTLNAALRSLGYDTQQDITGHGFRATARSMIREHLGWDVEVIERHLAHNSREELGEAYDRAKFVAQRQEMAQQWADFLDTLAAPPAPTLAVVGRVA